MGAKYRQVIANVNGIEDILSLEVTGSSGVTRFNFVTPSSSFDINDEVVIVAGFTDGSYTLMNGGVVDTVTAERPPGLYRIEGRDKLKKALDYFIVAASLDEADFFNPCPGVPGAYAKVSPTTAIDAILAECGLGGVTGSAPGWELGTEEDGMPLQLVSAWDAIQQICSIGAWRVWCTASGTIMFGSVLTPVGGGITLETGNEGQILSCSYSRSDENLRNKIVVIGVNGDYIGTASAVSPYVSGYKAAILSTDLLESDADCLASANANLTAFNRLTETTTVDSTGVGLELYNSVGVSEPFTGAPGGMITSITHTIDRDGYRVSLTATVV